MNGRADRFAKRITDILREHGSSVQALPTHGPRTAAAIARECINQGADLILAAGGDGTINETANGMIHSAVPLGIIPAGTANVLAMETRIPKRAEEAAKAIASATPQRISVGRLQAAGEPEPRHFLLMLGAGMDAQIVYNVNARLKDALGKGAYWLAAFLQALRPLPEFDVEISGRTRRCSFALASRVRNYGGAFEIARTASLLDHEFECVLFRGRHMMFYAVYVLAVVLRGHGRLPGVQVLRTESLRLSGAEDDRIFVQIDGEFAGKLPVRIDIVRDALTLLVPATIRERYRTRPQWTISHTR